MLVELSAADVYLNLRGRPRLDPSELVPGLRAKACGEIDDLPEGGLVLRPEWLRVKPGHLIRGRVSEAVPGQSMFMVDQGKIVQTFGDPVTNPPFAVRVDERTRYLHDASSEGELFDLCERFGDRLDVKLKGIGSLPPGTIAAFEVKARVVRDENGR